MVLRGGEFGKRYLKSETVKLMATVQTADLKNSIFRDKLNRERYHQACCQLSLCEAPRASPMRFIHAADVHLDSPLRGLDCYEGAPVGAIRGATRKAFANLTRLAIEECVDFVVLAGDLYDCDWPDYNTGLFFVNRMRELEEVSIPVVLLQGNHDAASRITARLRVPTNVHILPTDQPGTVKFDHLCAALHGQGYATQAETRNLAAQYPNPIPGYFNIGVLHTALDGREGHEPYAPCSLSDLLAREYDYWALGHVHQRESVNGVDRVRVEYPGNMQGRHIRETGAKGCLLVTVPGSGVAEPEFRALDVFRWAVVTVNAMDAKSPADVLDCAAHSLAVVKNQAEGRPLAARVVLSCHASVYPELARDRKQLRFDLAGQAGEDIWVEKIIIAQSSVIKAAEATISEGAAVELQNALAEVRADTTALAGIFAAGDCERFKNLLPPDLRDVIEDNMDEIFARAGMLLGSGSKTEQT